MAFSSDGSRLLAVQDEGDRKTHVVKSWDAATGRELSTVQLADGSMRARAFSPDGARFAAIMSGDSDTKRLRVWVLTTGQELPRFRVAQVMSDAWSLAFSPDGTQLRVIGTSEDRENKTAMIWDSARGEVIRTSPRFLLGNSARPAISPDGLRLATGGGNELMGQVTIWDA